MKDKCSLLVLAGMLVSMLYLTAGCSTYAGPAETGAIRGAAAGAIAGQAIGRNTKSTLIGAGIGAAGGAVLNDRRARLRGY